jgi:hypothetical protein
VQLGGTRASHATHRILTSADHDAAVDCHSLPEWKGHPKMGSEVLLVLGLYAASNLLFLGIGSLGGVIADNDPQAAAYDREEIAVIAQQIEQPDVEFGVLRSSRVYLARAVDGSAVHLVAATVGGGIFSGYRDICAPLLTSVSDPTGPFAMRGWKIASIGQTPVQGQIAPQHAVDVCTANAPAEQQLYATIRLVRNG